MSQAQREVAKAAAVKRQARASDAQLETMRACAERDILTAALKTMRHQLNRHDHEAMMASVIRAAVRRMIAVGDEDGLAEIAAIEPGFTSKKFIEGG